MLSQLLGSATGATVDATVFWSGAGISVDAPTCAPDRGDPDAACTGNLGGRQLGATLARIERGLLPEAHDSLAEMLFHRG